MKLNPVKLERIVYRETVRALRNPMPRGAVCQAPEGIYFQEHTIGSIKPGTFFYIHGRDGQKIFKMRMLDVGHTGRVVKAELQKMLTPYPNDKEIAENILNRISGGEIQLTGVDEKYISLPGGKPLLKKPVWKGGQE